jgi:hypothetical protein
MGEKKSDAGGISRTAQMPIVAVVAVPVVVVDVWSATTDRKSTTVPFLSVISLLILSFSSNEKEDETVLGDDRNLDLSVAARSSTAWMGTPATPQGVTVLQVAARLGHVCVLQMLVEDFSDLISLDDLDCHGDSAVILAAKN